MKTRIDVPMRPEKLNRRTTSSMLIALLVAAFWIASVQAQPKLDQTKQAQPEAAPEIRYVVVHSPGPKWKPGVPSFEQPGLQAHIDYYRTLLATHKLAMGGPFMDQAAGGMMIPAAGVTEEEIRKFAAADPAVKAGLLIFEVRPWMPAMRQ